MLLAYSKKKDGELHIKDNFKVKEFACKDGSDTVFIDTDLLYILQTTRNHFNSPIVINSGYRTDSYNKIVNGSTYSQHKYGRAADIKVKGVSPQKVAEYLETLLPNNGGIGIYPNFVHVDVRLTKARWKG